MSANKLVKNDVVKKILVCLNRKQRRCTYGAVAGILGVIPRGVGGYLGERCRKASWVVAVKSGNPSGYSNAQKHPNLYRNDKIIKTKNELIKFCHLKI